MSPAGQVRVERTLHERLLWATRHADPDVRGLAEAVVAQTAELNDLRDRVSALEAGREGDGK